MSTSSSNALEWSSKHLSREEVKLPSGRTVSVRELTLREVTSLAKHDDPGALTLSLALDIDEETAGSIGIRDATVLAKTIERMNSMGDGESPLGSKKAS